MRELALLTAVLYAGCGDADHHDDLPDAGTSAPDAAPDAASVGSILVTTYTRCCSEPPHTPAAGITVYVVGPDGRLAQTAATGADGRVTLDAVVAGSSVMAVYPPVDWYPMVVTTVLGVAPGDALVFGEGYGVGADTSSGGHITIDFPPITASSLVAWMPCLSTSQFFTTPPGTPYLFTSCQRPHATIPITAMDDNFQLLASAVLHDIDLSIGSTYTIDAWTPAIAQTATIVVPAGVTEVELEAAWPYPGILISDGSTASIADGSATATFAGPVGADATAVTARLFRNGLGEQEHARAFAAETPALAVEMTALPWLGTPIVDIAEEGVHWSQDGAGGDAVAFRLLYEHADDGVRVDWTVIAPAGATELSWANLPAEVPAPRGHDIDNGASVVVIDLGPTSSYAEVRSTPEWNIRCPTCAVQRNQLPAAAAAVAQGSELGW
jgi:hypothetical protein